MSNDNQCTITIKSTKEKKEIKIHYSDRIKMLKDICSKEFLLLPDQICLIFAGCILKEEDLISNYNITNDSVVHLIIKSASKTFEDMNELTSQRNQMRSQADISQTPFNLSRIGGIAGLANLGFGSANFMDLQQKIQKEMFANPELLRMLVENPVVSDIISNPNLMTQLIACNPQMCEIIQENPEVLQMIHNPTLLKQMLELAQVPTVLQEMISPKYRQFSEGSQIEVSDPCSSDKNVVHKDTEAAADSVWMDQATESVMRQYMEDGQVVMNMMHAPYIQSIMTKLSSNPQLLAQLLPFVPAANNNPQLLALLQQSAPYFAKQLGSLDVQSLLSNRKAMQALLDIQQGMQALHEEVPALAQAQTGSSSTNDMLINMLTMVNSAGLPGEDAEKSYALQLHQLNIMGFNNVTENIQALTKNHGDVNATLKQLTQI